MSITVDQRVNTNVDFYLDQDPRKAPAAHLREFVRARARGQKLLDFGAGVGAYAYELMQLGFDVTAIDANASYVAIADSIGVRSVLATGEKLPFPDSSFDTAYLLEVLEHLPDDVIHQTFSELRRVTRNNILITVPDNSDYDELVKFDFLYGHYRAIDHIQFFTTSSLGTLLSQHFPRYLIEQGDFLFPHLLLPPLIRRPVSLLYRLGLAKPTISSRLFAEAWVNA